MIQSKRSLIIALAIPILALLGLTAYKAYIFNYGQQIVLPITGYDPRDLLSGHYLVYEVLYGIEDICKNVEDQSTAYVCLEPKSFSKYRMDDCSQVIRGTCTSGRFKAGIEKFFIPQEQARELERKIQTKSASIVLSINKAGKAQVKDLLIDGKPWHKQ